ncbi:MAG: DUF4835 family protein [Ignavibacteria bacterium]|nr:DUF4835 family protein [Ignavibacteria bacterium]
MKKALFILLILLSTLRQGQAQEFLCDISVSAPEIEGTDRRAFESLQSALYEFMNNRKWTNVNIKNLERIECTMLITIRERISSDEYRANLNVVLRRPIYKTAYNSISLNFVDENFQFKYIESQTLEFSETSFISNLTSVMGFYAYVMLGLDFDSYALNGGDAFFLAADAIVNSAQGANETGWKAFDGYKNRYWLIENIRNPAYRSLRQFNYEYHRMGLDMMADNPDEGRANILNALTYLEQTHKARSGLFLMQLIMDAKRDELINVFTKGSPQEKTKAANILRLIDPANSSKYDKIVAN